MDPEDTPIDPAAPEPTSPTTEPTAPAPAPAAPTAAKPKGDARIVTVETLTRQVREAEAKARQDERAKLDKQAQGLGYRNHEDMILQLKNRRQVAPGNARRAAPTQSDDGAEPDPEDSEDPADPTPATPQSSRKTRRTELENQRLADQVKAANVARLAADRRARDLQRKLDEKEAELGLRTAAVRAGVTDVDYAIHLVRKAMATMSEADLAAFDEDTYFSATLRNKFPHLYAVETEPAHTDPAAPTPPPAPKVPEAPPPETSQKDMRQVSPQEFAESLRKRGLTPPGLGLAG